MGDASMLPPRGDGGGVSSEGGTHTDGGSHTGDAGTVPISPNAFYVATNGSDSNPGTLAQPFATLGKAQSAMQAGALKKTTYIRAGTYMPATTTNGSCLWGDSSGSSVGLSSADNGETWSFYPPDGYGSAILDGQSTTGNSGGMGGNGTGCGFGDNGATDVTVVGLAFQHYRYSAFWGYAANGAMVSDNVIHDTTAASWGEGAIILTASPGATVQNNYVYNVAYHGIAIEDNSSTGDQMSNDTVANNVVLSACGWPAVSGGNDQDGGDCGAIYVWSNFTSRSTNLRITNNYVRDVNMSSSGAGDFGQCCAVGIYLDDGVNNVTESQNVVTGVKSTCFHIHGGSNNIIQGSLCDLGSSGTENIVTYQDDTESNMTGNVFQNNIVVGSSTGPGNGFWGVSGPKNPMTIKNNGYFNYVGSTLDSNSTGDNAGSDANPTYVNPGISCWSPALASGSPVASAPVSFQIVGGWGPPGFAMPQTGTAPSWPHGC
jgi:hypothetical protein